MELGIIGTSIWQQNMRLLERLTVDRQGKLEQLEEIKKHLGVDELVYLSTCNRVEFIYVAPQKSSASQILYRLIDYFFADGRDISFFPNDFFQYSGREAVRHLFRTVSSLDSLVVGETQITGQFKEATQEAVEYGLAGPTLQTLANEALSIARKVRNETNIGDGAVSMASLAFTELESHLAQAGDQPTVALVGAGPMSSKMARYIRTAKLGKILFVNRTVEKAAKLAEQYDGTPMALAEFLETAPAVDAIVTATACSSYVFTADFLEKIDHGRPVMCIDLAIPKDFAPEFAHDERIILVDIPTLKNKEQNNLRRKFVESSKANELVSEAVQAFLRSRLEISMKPILRNSYEESLSLATRALNDVFEKKLASLADDQKQVVRNLVTKLIGHSSFQPARILSNHLADLQDQLLFDIFEESRKEAV